MRCKGNLTSRDGEDGVEERRPRRCRRKGGSGGGERRGNENVALRQAVTMEREGMIRRRGRIGQGRAQEERETASHSLQEGTRTPP